MGRAHEKWHICKCLVFHAENLLKVYTQKNSGYTKSRRKIRQQKIPKIDSKFLHIELLSREAWASKDTRFLTLSFYAIFTVIFNYLSNTAWSLIDFIYSRYQIPSIIRFFITNDPFVYAHLWYLFALIYCYLFIALFDNRRFSKKLIIVIVLLLCVFSILSEFKTILNISSSILIPNSEKRVYLFNLFILRALPFVLLGGYLRTYGSIPNNSRNRLFILSIVLIFLGSIACIFEKRLFLESQFYLGTYLVVVGLILISGISIITNRKTVLGYIGQNLSLYVYIFHIAVGKSWDLFATKIKITQTSLYQNTRAIFVLGITLLISLAIYKAKCAYQKSITK